MIPSGTGNPIGLFIIRSILTHGMGNGNDFLNSWPFLVGRGKAKENAADPSPLS
jgi:hypothetical protein